MNMKKLPQVLEVWTYNHAEAPWCNKVESRICHLVEAMAVAIINMESHSLRLLMQGREHLEAAYWKVCGTQEWKAEKVKPQL